MEKHTKRFKKARSVALLLSTLLLCVSAAGCRSSTPVHALTANQTFTLPTEVKSTPVNFLNGSFQTPDMANRDPAWPYVPGCLYVPQGSADGWYTYPVNTADLSNPNWKYIEFQNVGGTIWSAPTAADGNQYAELNADVVSRLYQVVNTTPNSRLYYQFAHRAQQFGNNQTGDGHDVMDFYLRPSGTPTTAPNSSQLVTEVSDDAHQWYYHRGVYTVPAGQTSTEFDFVSVSSATGDPRHGNFLDDIKFQTGSSLIAKKSITTSAGEDGAVAYKGETITVTVAVTNWGETDASRCVFNDAVDGGLTYVPGSAKINGAAAGSLATFDNTSSNLRIDFGTGATAGTADTNGGVLKGSQSMGTSSTTGQGETATITYQATVAGNVGDAIKDQASVGYNDYNYESYNPTDFIAYSSVKDKTPTAGDESTYVNQFTVVDRTVSGRAWVDMNGNGKIDPGETGIPGAAVGLYPSTDTTYTTPVNDENGSPLVTTTDASGNYSFNAIPSGVYKVVMATPSGYKVTLQQTGTDNEANADVTHAVVSGINLTAPLTPTNTQDIAGNVDLGFDPQPTIAKAAQVNGGAADPGTAANPVGVNAGDTVTYTLNVQWSGQLGSLTGATISDVLPAGLTLVTDAGSYTDGMTWSTDPASGRTTVTWANQTVPSGTTTYSFKAVVDKPQVGAATTYTNAAALTLGASTFPTNSTYHTLNTYDLGLSKLVKGALADPNQPFTFTIMLSGMSGSLPYTGTSTVTGVAAPPSGTIASGGTVTLKHGQSITISGVLSGTDYTITEQNAVGYTQTVADNNAVGTVANAGVNVQFVNTKNGAVPSGAFLNLSPYIAMMLLAALVLSLILGLHHERKVRAGYPHGRHDDYRGL